MSESDHSRRDFLKAAVGALAVATTAQAEENLPTTKPKSSGSKKLLLLSNGRLEGQDTDAVIAEHFQASSKTPKTVLYIPYAKSATDYDYKVKSTSEEFAPFGIKIIAAPEPKDALALLKNADGVLVDGGNTFRLLARLQENGLLAAIKSKVESGMPYGGYSAGINVTSPTIATTNDMPIVTPQSLDALGLVPFQINPHYVEGQFYYKDGKEMIPYGGETRDERLTQFHEENDRPIVALREGSGLRIIGDKVELLGGKPDIKPATIFIKGKAPVNVSDGHAIAELMSALDQKVERK